MFNAIGQQKTLMLHQKDKLYSHSCFLLTNTANVSYDGITHNNNTKKLNSVKPNKII